MIVVMNVHDSAAYLQCPSTSSFAKDRCVTSLKFIKRNTSLTYCAECYFTIAHKTNDYELITTHHLTNTLYPPCFCSNCDCDLIRSRFIHVCWHCVQQHKELLLFFERDRTSINNVTYRVDISRKNIEFIRKN